MTEEIGVMRGDSLSLKVPEEWVDSYEHTFQQVAVNDKSDEDIATVMLVAGFTRLRVQGEPVYFTGFRYFPNIHDSPLDAYVDMKDDWGGYIDSDHPAHDLTVNELHRGMKSGKIIPLGKKERER